MIAPRVHRYRDRAALAAHVGDALVRELTARQSSQDVANVALCGGPLGEAVIREFAGRVITSGVDPRRLELWWVDERFVAPDDDGRRALQALKLLGGAFPVDPARTHPMPSPMGSSDVEGAALAYAAELGDTVFDVCLLAMGRNGRVAGLLPGKPLPSGAALCVGLDEPQLDPPRRLTLTPASINRSLSVWLLASGAASAHATAQGVAQDPSVPAGAVHGTQYTRWFIDDPAARELPGYRCRW